VKDAGNAFALRFKMIRSTHNDDNRLEAKQDAVFELLESTSFGDC